MKLTGRIRYRRYDHGLLLEVEVHDTPRLVKVGEDYIAEQRRKWRDADERDLQELHGMELEAAADKAFDEGVRMEKGDEASKKLH